jgi:twitching motility protein PilT
MAEIDYYLQFMVEQGASDFHLSSTVRPALRINGQMVRTTAESTEPFTPDQVWTLLEEIIPERNRKQFVEESDTDFAYALAGIGRFRVNVFEDNNGTGAVFRHIPDKIMTFEELGLPQILYKLCGLHKGIILVTGPTGSGKSTTLAAIVDYLNNHRNSHIITLEDPIEFVHQNRRCIVNQREIHRHTDSFKRALRAALRQDPDIVLVGEMRDLETTEMAIRTAETGHLVLATLHTSTAASTVDRIIDQFPADQQAQVRTMLSVSLKGIVCQTLMRRKDGQGRVAAFEIMVGTSAISNLIREGKTFQIPNAIQTGGSLGMQELNAHLLTLVENGVVDAKEAHAHSVDKAAMQSRLSAAGFDLQG